MKNENIVYQGRFIKVTEVSLESAIWEKVYLHDGVIIYPVTHDNKILLIKERRPHEIKPFRLKFVTGLLEQNEDVYQAANRELQEEIGQKAKSLKTIIYRRSSGTINNHLHQIIATDLTPNKIPNPDGEDTIMEVIPYSLKEIFDLIKQGELPWDQAALGIFKIREDGLLPLD